MSKRVNGFLVPLAIAVISLGAAAASAGAAITSTNSAPGVANAIAADPGIITGASFDTIQDSAAGIGDSPLAGFPLVGPNYGLLTTGDPQLADDPNVAGDSGVDLLGGNVRGDTDQDVTILSIGLTIPAEKNCLGVDFRFASDEFPEFVGSRFNDAFIAELDSSTWTTSGSDITAPNNFALDPGGHVISINGTGPATVTAAQANGTTYDAATPILRAQKVVTPGAHTVYLSIFDQGDGIYDSAVFLDRAIAARSVDPGACTSQLVTPTACFGQDSTTVGTPGADLLRGTRFADVISGLGGKDKILGLQGDDLICGGLGKDKVRGGPGKDKIRGEAGKDSINGGGGKDKCIGGGGKDKGARCEKGKL